MDVSSLLFLSMLRPAELHISTEIKFKPKAFKGKVKNLKTILSKTISKDLFKRKPLEESSLDSEIEMAIADIKSPQQKDMINELLMEKRTENPDLKYETMANKTFDEIKTSFKKLYTTFLSYTKGAYTSIKSKTKKVVTGPVRITIYKLIRVGEYIMAAISPQWNKVTGSPEDLDTLSPAMTNHIILDSKNRY